MGITGLAKLIADFAPNAIKENEIKNHFGKLLYLYIIIKRFEYKLQSYCNTRHLPHI